MRRLEQISESFNYELTPRYVQLAKEFLRNIQSVVKHNPFFDICEDCQITLPQNYEDRLCNLFGKKYEYSPSTRNVCKWFLKELLAMDMGLRPAKESTYEPLIKMLEMGGRFYEHHGDLCIEDAATILL